VITGFKGQDVRNAICEPVEFVDQAEQMGTGHAVLQTEPLLDGAREQYVLVICGDTPLLRAETLQGLIDACCRHHASASVLTAVMENPNGYGRIIRDAGGAMKSIVEQKDGNPDELAVHEVNTGTYCFEVRALFEALHQVKNDNVQGEYYLTDVFSILIREGQTVIPVEAKSPEETLGVNSRRQLSEADHVLRRRKIFELMDSGVSVIDPDHTYIGQDVKIGQDSILYPGCILEGSTVIGKHCIIGPNTHVCDFRCGNFCRLESVYAHNCSMGDRNEAGPFVHLRPQTQIGNDVKIGNFVEIKNSVIGDHSKLPHLIYCGDADMGSRVNMGCGSVTVNFDGNRKHRTKIGDHAFIGCNTNLVAPVAIGQRAFTAAGSTITRDVPENALAVGRSRQKNIENWVQKDTYKE
jgi:bifunctional UDP-N-acetylglucosamine pyrophosphorylase/glucosamine-1-phosphate N-acetyltransferase